MKNQLVNQIEFIVEIDKLKRIIRRSRRFDNSKYENTAEHSWHIAVMAMVLSTHVNEDVNIDKVIKMLLIHDIVEIDAGDTFLYAKNQSDKFHKESIAAKRIFSILGEPQGSYFTELWEEYEDHETPEARFAKVLDRLEPLMQNYYTKGHTWKKYQITKEMALKTNEFMQHCSETLWDYAKDLIESASCKGYFFTKNEYHQI